MFRCLGRNRGGRGRNTEEGASERWLTPESLERFRRAAEEHGLVERRDEDGTVPEHVATIRPVGELEPDTRLTNERCAISAW